MPRNPPMQIEFPAAGVVRRLGVRDSTGVRGAFPTPWAMNVRLEDSLTNRLRGGSFTAQAAGTKDSPVYRDRAITFSSNVITAARQGDSSDTALSVDISDTARPIIFQLSLADATGSTVVAVIPHKDAYMLCFTASETWVLMGDPATGQLRRVSDEVGIIGASAWCVNHDTVYFLSARGLYSVGADGSGLKPISEDKIPEHLIGLADTSCVLDYYHADRGVYIHPTTATAWFYDTARDQFWPFDLDETGSHLLLGPLYLGQENSYGRIQSLQGNMAAGSATVTWRVITGDTAEEAAANGKAAIDAAVAGSDYSSYVKASGEWSAGRSHISYPRTRSIWCCIWLSASSDWAYEAMAMTRSLSGRWR
jgi:hypothetical protein